MINLNVESVLRFVKEDSNLNLSTGLEFLDELYKKFFFKIDKEKFLSNKEEIKKFINDIVVSVCRESESYFVNDLSQQEKNLIILKLRKIRNILIKIKSRDNRDPFFRILIAKSLLEVERQLEKYN